MNSAMTLAAPVWWISSRVDKNLCKGSIPSDRGMETCSGYILMNQLKTLGEHGSSSARCSSLISWLSLFLARRHLCAAEQVITTFSH